LCSYGFAVSRRILFATQSDAVTTLSDATWTEKEAFNETFRAPLIVDAKVADDKEDMDFFCDACLSYDAK
jgi:hypothetical protein